MEKVKTEMILDHSDWLNQTFVVVILCNSFVSNSFVVVLLKINLMSFCEFEWHTVYHVFKRWQLVPPTHNKMTIDKIRKRTHKDSQKLLLIEWVAAKTDHNFNTKQLNARKRLLQIDCCVSFQMFSFYMKTISMYQELHFRIFVEKKENKKKKEVWGVEPSNNIYKSLSSNGLARDLLLFILQCSNLSNCKQN